MRHLGIAAHSVEGAALCFREFAGHGFRDVGSHQHPDVTMDCIAMGRSMPAWDAGDLPAIRTILELSIDRLARAGADFFVCPDNTAHIALESAEGSDFRIPGLHIADVVSGAAADRGYTSVGILGTRYTMSHSLYPRVLATRGIDAQVPPESDQVELHRIIFDELVEGVLHDDSRRTFCRVIDDLRGRGCDAVALVCTEIPLLVSADDSSLPVLDSTRLLARAAFDVAMGRAPMPQWRGGPWQG